MIWHLKIKIENHEKFYLNLLFQILIIFVFYWIFFKYIYEVQLK